MAKTTDILPPEEAQTLDALFRARVARSPEREAYCEYDRDSGTWRSLTWAQVGREVARWRAALAKEGLQPGDRVALALRNGIDWVCFDQAALSLGLVVVPLYPDDRADSLAFLLEDAGVRLLLLQDAGRWRRLAPALDSVASLERILLLGEGRVPDRRVRFLSEWLPVEADDVPPRPSPPEAPATLVYTSGTYGRPKGVLLSHRNILSNVHAALALIVAYPDDRFLSFLPLAHMLERTGGYYLPLAAGACVAFARSIPQLGADFASQRPTVIIAVPRIFETAYGRISRRLAEGPAWRRRLFEATVAAGWRRFLWTQGVAGWHPGVLAAPLLQSLVGRPVLRRLGGRVRVAVSGGAALSPELARTFIGLGLNLCQGYGLTEASPVVAFNPPEDNRPESIGRPLPGIEVRIDHDGELLVRGPSVMLGYWRAPEATAAAIDAAGWLHTGDLARLEDSHLYLTGRRKEILVLSNGENIPPAPLEGAIALDPLFDQVMIVGEGKPFLSALAVINPDSWQRAAQALGVSGDQEGLRTRQATQFLLSRIGSRLHAFPRYAKVRRIHATLEPWTVESGLLTPTLKLRRQAILRRFAADVAALYEEKA